MTLNRHNYFIANHDRLWNAFQHTHTHVPAYICIYTCVQSEEIEAKNLKAFSKSNYCRHSPSCRSNVVQ